MENTESNTKSHSEKRSRAAAKWTVRATEAERELIQVNAEATGLHPSSLMRELALGHEPKSIIDVRHMLELVRLRGDLGRVGGLLKKHMNDSDGKNGKLAVGLIRDIESLKDEIRSTLRRLDSSI